MFATLRTEFPAAHVFASTFDAYIDALEEAAPRLRLPVITGGASACHSRQELVCIAFILVLTCTPLSHGPCCM